MMREIKFRAWIPSHKIMAKSDLRAMRLDDGLLGDKEYEEAVFMQYTGLKDKNGKEIYEGDIVKHYDYPHCKVGGISSVKWDKDACGFRPFIEDNERYGRPSAGEWIEVLGNIYENPELIQ